MAQDLEDGEFWLPSEILNDADMAMDFHFATSFNGSGGGSSVLLSDITSSETGSFDDDDDDDDDILALTHPLSSCPVHSKVVLSSSPQSTLYGCVCNQSSSCESVSPPQPQPPSEDTATNTATFDLLNKAAGEVARLKIDIENNKNKKLVGTGFFDCTQKGVSYPPPLLFQPQFLHYSHPPMVQLPHRQPPSQNRATKNVTKSINNRPLGLPPSAWPPLQAQAQQPAKPKTQPNSMGPISVGPTKGTGVFLPRCIPAVTTANQIRKKDGNTNMSKTGKGSQSHSNYRKNSSKTSAVKTSTMMTNNNNIDIQLPQEWTY